MIINLLKYSSILSFFLLIGCDQEVKTTSNETAVVEDQPSIVLISKDNNGHIGTWIRLLDNETVIKECYGLSKDSLDYYLLNADAIIIGGGEDVNPKLYNKPEYAEICGEFDNYRDSLEIKMIHYAANKKIPLMGICRGQQIINIAHGGTLIPDIPTYVKDPVTHRSDKDSAHIIIPLKETWFSDYFKQDTFWVNSRHHQSIGRLADGFAVAAYSKDSVIEAIYIKDKSKHPFTMAVQFHPENLRDSLSNQFGMLFLNSID
jgi:putative glutamine amidotransferase